MNKTILLAVLIAAILSVTMAKWVWYDEEVATLDAADEDEHAVESFSQSACDSLKYRNDDDIVKLASQVSASTDKLEELKKGLASLSAASQAFLTGAHVEQLLKLFPSAAKLSALKVLDGHFYLIEATHAVAILKSITKEELCSLGDFSSRVLEATDASKRSCVFSRVDSSLVLFVIDVSPSMWFKYNGVARISMVRQEFANMVKTLQPEQSFNIIRFGGNVYRWKNGAVKAVSENVAAAITHLNAVTEVGSTNINDALEVAVADVPATVKDATIFFLTDGVPNAGRYTDATKIIDNITALNKKRENPITINTVSFLLGITKDEQSSISTSQGIITQIAAKNGGVARVFAEK